MANNSTKQVHVSPGIYFSESELPVASKSLGITNLGVAGETLRGPAFQPIEVSTWSQYQSYFGGTSTEKFRGSQYPKYELPYIAKTYLEQSQSLKVCRILGLSGVNAGPAWIITAWGDTIGGDYTEEKPMVVAVLRSRGEHRKAAFVAPADPDKGICTDQYEYDKIVYFAKNIKLVRSKSLVLMDGCNPGFDQTTNQLTINANNYGTFGLEVTLNDGSETPNTKTYSVSFNPSDKNYIYNVLGGDPEKGETEIYVEELYDIALRQLIERGELNTLGEERDLPMFEIAHLIPKHATVNDILTEDESTLTRNDVGKRFLYSSTYSVNEEDGSPLKVHVTNDNGVSWVAQDGEVGHIYTVVAYTTSTGTREYYYGEYITTEGEVEINGETLGEPTISEEIVNECVYVNNDGLYYVKFEEDSDIKPITLDLNNYKEPYRYSSTPWVVSEIKGSGNNIELSKLFRFHTISDGDNSRLECKVSIENIDTFNGTFDVLIRDFNDTDGSPIILERYKNVNLIPGSANYIALRIGSFDETYETKSRYVTVEVNENDSTKTSIPAGFLGFPVRNYEGDALGKNVGDVKLQKPYFQYNTTIYDEIREKKQYFGMSDLTGVDEDVLKYKGVEAYNDEPKGLTPSFHLDSRILSGKPDDNGKVVSNGIEQTVSVDGVTGYEWVTVDKTNTVGNYGIEPRIGTEEEMYNTIYEDKRWRKFTVYFYGGFDGWDYYRTSRSNSDEFKYQKYRGEIDSVSGEGKNFSLIYDAEKYGLDIPGKAITSDWYAYLAGIRQFANPKETDINVFATPGIDYVNNNLLVSEVIEMIEDERADSIYVITTPDKPFGAGDTKLEMYSPNEAVANLEASNIDSNWACTYYPWIKYYDSSNSQYIYLPPTKDVVKNFAFTDNTYAPWFASAGWNRGLSDGIKSKKNLVLSEQDELYSGRINFINNFADEGMRIWGDNNLQIAESNAHMNKISKRRCLIRLRKLISIACIGLVFDPNDPTTITTFRTAVNSILEDFVSKRAIVDAKLVIDDSIEARDRLELNAQIYIKFMPNVEYVNIGLIATPNGVSFDDI